MQGMFCCFVCFFIRNNRTKREQCILYHCSVFLYCCSVFALLFYFPPQRNDRNKMEQCVLYHCSVFLYRCSFFRFIVPFFHNGTKNGTVCFCTTVPFFAQLFTRNKGTKTEQYVLYHCSEFLHYCSVFFIRDNKTKQDSVVLTTVLFFFFHMETTNKKGAVVQKHTAPFLHYCSIFVPFYRFFHKGRLNKTKQCDFNLCSVFALLFHFRTTEQKLNSLFLYHCSVFPIGLPLT